jgi:pyruvate dehydrogenase E2 component (dihydrolipoyllysine-residue acetyltransferase)
MAKKITIPRLGWSMEEGTFASWIKNDGDRVSIGDALFALEGEKSLQEVESLDAGILRTLPESPKIGETVKVGQLIGYLVGEGEQLPAAATFVSSPPPASNVFNEKEIGAERVRAKSNMAVSTPRARRTAAALGMEIDSIQGTGWEGRVRERDVKAASEATATVFAPATDPETSNAKGIPISLLRRTIAERMMTSLANTAPVTLTTRVNATNLVALRKSLKDSSDGALPPSYTEIIAKLTAITISEFPTIAGRWTADRIDLPDEINIGVAVDTEAGLVVPVIRDAFRISLPELAKRSRALIEAARGRSLKVADMQGGSFTITNLGGLGVDSFTPIINYPEVAILGLGAIRRIPAVLDDGTIAPVAFMTLSLTFDHRVLDGAPAARFLQTLVRAMEYPTARLLGFPSSASKSGE